MSLRTSASLALFALLSLACGDNTTNASASDGASGDACFPGHEGCDCAEGGVCLAGLVCVADRCESTDPTSVPTGTGTDGATAGSQSASESASGGVPTEGASESGNSATATDTTPATATDTTQSTATDTTQSTATDTATDTTPATATDTTQGTDSDTGPETDTGVGPDSTTSTTDGTTNPGTTQGDTEDTTGGVACGDGVAEGQEACDGADLKGASCIGLGFEAGALGCTAACVLDTTNCTNSVACGDGMPAGLSFKPAAMVNQRYTTSLNRGDLNEDGHLDLVATNPTTMGIGIWFGDGNTLSGNPDKTHPTLTHVAKLVVDVDKDGHLDVVGDKAYKDVYVSYGDGDGNLVAGEVYDTFMHLRWVALGDLDEDGWYEMAAGFAGFTDVVTVRRGQFGGLFGPAVAYDAPLETWLGGFADMDADGHLDVWSVTGQGAFLHYRGDGAGGLELQPMQPVMSVASPNCGLVGHFNGDAYPDVAVGRFNTDAALHVRLGGAAGLGAMLYKYPADGGYAVASAAGHFDCDEFLDIAVLTDGDCALDVFRGDGTGLFYDGQDLDPGLHAHFLTAGDFNEDGVDDLVSGHYYTQTEEEAIKIFLSDP
ncbi:FG-GAP repeat domain-containing protein [Nannocystis radixulma]|uniref:VCBS repeat-containing protein n=1 Tax=Nannocystis radixulma TaxID=2995305 RepID=A0ABT5BPD9_9BACT|nr:VCBS repeat-containing protein [Nannocystis radixulma]MDC0676035.1 VCBS repeat-containing protein [Nannocystis radixulma]